MFSYGRQPSFESLEARTVLCGNASIDICLLQRTEDAVWQFRQDGQNQTIDSNLVGDAGDWNPDLLADFTGDGIEDVLGRRSDGSWWLQVNDGTQLFDSPFTPLSSQPIAAQITILGAFDIDDNNKLDVLSVADDSGDIWVSLNETKSFDDQVWGSFGQSTADLELFVDDFTGDGLLDVLSGGADGLWRLAENTGSSFEIQDWGSFPQFNWQVVVSGDFTGDGLPDVAALGPDNTWWMWQASDSGLMPARFWGHWKMHQNWHDIRLGDFDNDGRDDLIGRSEDGRLWVGSATDTRFHTWWWGKGWVHRADWTDVTIVDVNGDGRLDQVGQANDHTWWYAENTGSRFRNSFWQRGEDVPYAAIAIHINADEATDVVPFLPDGGTDVREGHIRASLNDDNKIVLTGMEVDTHGLELLSASGSLIPIPPGDTSAPADPFQILLANEATNVTYATLSTFQLNGELVLEVGWDPDSTAQDLVINYGTGTPLQTALVTAPLGNDPGAAETQADINKVYFETIANLEDHLSN